MRVWVDHILIGPELNCKGANFSFSLQAQSSGVLTTLLEPPGLRVSNQKEITSMYRCYLIANGQAIFTKKLTLEKCMEWLQVIAANSWVGGMVDAELSLNDAKAVFKDVVEPTCGWEG